MSTLRISKVVPKPSLRTIIEEWPEGFPPVLWLNLYVAADRGRTMGYVG